MVGYPKGLRDRANNLPIFRRGITATHPKFNYMGKPEFLVDMACFPGSSGSPVFILNEGTYTDKRSGTFSIGSRIYLLGIQYAVPNLKDLGELISVPSQQIKVKPLMQSFINLGIIVKSSELMIFESILNQGSTNKSLSYGTE